MCTDGTSTSFDAISTPRSFTFSGLKRSFDSEGNPLQQDACTYEIKETEHYFKSGQIVLRFNGIEESDVYINTGKEVHTAIEVVSDGVKMYKEYTVDMSKGSVFAIVVPKEGVEQTSFTMQYWVDGDETSALVEWWWRNFSTTEGKGMLAFALVCIVLLCAIVGFGVKYFFRTQ